MADTINSKLPLRRVSRPYDITLSDTLTDKNLQVNGTPFKWIQNVGTGGLVMIAWEPNADLVDIYLGTGQVIELGLCRHAKTTGTGAGVDLRGFLQIGPDL